MIILLSNDDGIQADGIQSLFEALAPIHEVWIVAPDREQSGASHKLTMGRPLRAAERGPRQFAVEGTPTDAVYLALNGLLSVRPDLLISGINHGPNLADDVTYSGTVAAAIEGTIQGIPSMAVSLASFSSRDFSGACDVVRKLIEQWPSFHLKDGILLNVNIPAIPNPAPKMVKTCLGRRNYGQFTVKRQDPRGKDYYWIGGKMQPGDFVEGSDVQAVESGSTSITPLTINLTDFDTLQTLNLMET